MHSDVCPQSRYFVDHRRVRLVAGSGGKGACSFHSEPRKEWGGPDGGNGGDGGSISFKGERILWTKIVSKSCTLDTFELNFRLLLFQLTGLSSLWLN